MSTQISCLCLKFSSRMLVFVEINWSNHYFHVLIVMFYFCHSSSFRSCNFSVRESYHFSSISLLTWLLILSVWTHKYVLNSLGYNPILLLFYCSDWRQLFNFYEICYLFLKNFSFPVPFPLVLFLWSLRNIYISQDGEDLPLGFLLDVPLF